MNKALTPDQLLQAATERGYNPHSVKAVQIVEAAGAGFLKDGRPKILFERHWFHKLTQGIYTPTHPHISNPKPGGYLGGTAEWARLDEAIELNRQAALLSASWGLGQVMGFNHKAAGHPTVQSLVNAAYKSEYEQLVMMLNFIGQNPTLHRVMKLAAPTPADWAAFAKGYNGANYKINAYDVKLANAYAKCLKS